MRTGGGKSLLFMLPAWAAPGGVTIVVMPKVMLQEDMADRCRQQGIPVAVWSDNHAPPYEARIVFVIAESAVSVAFADFINAKVIAHQLDRIVIDECHTILDSNATWRPAVLRLYEMAGRTTQIVCLTATLPPCEQATFVKAIDIEEAVIIRDRTRRTNIRYRVEEYDPREEGKAIQAIIDARLPQYPPDSRVIVYCRSIARVQAIAAEIHAVPFYRAVGNLDNKRRILQQLTTGPERVFVVTNALGEGIDVATVRIVIHVGSPDTLKQYSQESGRAGRDVQCPSEAIIMSAVVPSPARGYRAPGHHRMERVMQAFIAGQRCRKAVMEEHMDGIQPGRPCSDEASCDVCVSITQRRKRPINSDSPVVEEEPIRKHRAVETPSSAPPRPIQYTQEMQAVEAIPRRQQAQAITRSRSIEQLQALFMQWKSGCGICRIHGRVEVDHEWAQCPHAPASFRKDIAAGIEWMGQIRWSAAWVCCRQCWAPQAICQRYTPIDGRGPERYRQVPGQTCQFARVLRTAASIVVNSHSDVVIAWIEEQAAQDGVPAGPEGIGIWLGRLHRGGGVEMSGLCRLFSEWATVIVPAADQEITHPVSSL
jgi:superfamily II DNA or RNA helicase